MESVNTIDPGELAPLKQLASEFLAADAVEIGVLDRIASLATELAVRSREQARVKMIDVVEARALPLLPAAADDLRSRLSPLSLDALSGLAALLEQAVTARAAFEEADSGLMAARRRGDYAAMAPLALEADAQKSALETTTVEFTERLGLADVLAEEAPSAEMPAAEPAAPPVNPEVSGELAAPSELAAPLAAADEFESDGSSEPLAEVSTPESAPGEAEPAEAQPERRRLRALIRQMRPDADEAPATR
jgi:hypothetical protein